MTPPLGPRTIAQVGIIVRDIEAKAKAWSELFGLPMPEIKETAGYEVSHAQYGGQPTTARAKLAFLNFGQVDVELIEPIGGPSTWKDQLDQHGPSLHHLAFRFASVDELTARAPFLESKGLKEVQRGDYLPNGRYIYMDGIEQLGCILELLPGQAAKRDAAD